LNILRELGVGCRDDMLCAFELPGGNANGVAGAQLYRMSSSEFPGAYFRTLKIHHNAQITSRFAGGSSEEFAGLFVFSMGAVRKIQSGDIHTGQQQLFHHFKGVGTGSDGADYLGASGG